MSVEKSAGSYLASVLACRCPRCREGKLFARPYRFGFKHVLDMNKSCPVCGQPTEIEVGFYYGTSYVSYALSVAISVASAVAWWVIIGFSANDNRFLYWIFTNAILLVFLQPYLMRLSRSVWISWFVGFDPYWNEHNPADVSERLNDDQGNNW